MKGLILKKLRITHFYFLLPSLGAELLIVQISLAGLGRKNLVKQRPGVNEFWKSFTVFSSIIIGAPGYC